MIARFAAYNRMIMNKERKKEEKNCTYIGGQAVMEGVMMRNGSKYAIAVRKPDQTIEVKVQNAASIKDKYSILKIPIVRGVVSFVESLAGGAKALTFSAQFYVEDEEKTKFE